LAAPARADATPQQPRRPVALLAIGLALTIALILGGIRAFRASPASSAPTVAAAPNETAPAAPAAPAAGQAPNEPSAPPATTHGPPRPAKAAALAKATSSVAGTEVSSSGAHEVIPEIPDRARRTIRGHVRVSIRVIVEKDGSVFAALTEQRGPSRYFERLALDAAKKWTFTPAQADARRFTLIQFDFSRAGATAQAGALK
jgi:TonB family protein